MTSIDTLDCYVIAKIISFLPIDKFRIETNLVCKKWYEANRDNKSKVLHLDLCNKKFVKEKFNDSIPNQLFLINLITEYCGNTLNTFQLNEKYDLCIMYRVVQTCTKLHSLYIDFNKRIDYELPDSLKKLSNLKSIKFVNYDISNGLGRIRTIRVFNQCPSGIEKLGLICDKAWIKLPLNHAEGITRFIHLQSLELTDWKLDEDSLRIILKISSLKYLDINGCQIEVSEKVTSNLPNLETIDCKYVNGEVNQMVQILSSSKNLKNIDFSDTVEHITKSSLYEFNNWIKLKSLKLINQQNLDDEVLEKWFFEELKYFTCIDCDKVSKRGLEIFMKKHRLD